MTIDGVAADAEDGTLLDLMKVILSFRRVLVLSSLGLGCLVAVGTLASAREYAATAAFLPQSGSGPLARLAGLAAQLGVAVPGQEPSQSVDFYGELVSSATLLRGAVVSSYPTASGDSIDLITYYRKERGNRAFQIDGAVRALRRNLAVSTNAKTGVIRFVVTLKDPVLAAAVAGELLDRVNQFNVDTRQTIGKSQREFIETRLASARRELATAEEEVQRFLEENRQFRDSPKLVFQHDRLQREVDRRQQVYTSLAQSFEQARVDEVRDTPAITTVERPIVAARPVSRRVLLKTVLSTGVAFFLGLLGVLSYEAWRRAAEARPDLRAAVRALWLETLDDLRRPTRRLRNSSDHRTNGP